MSGADELDEAVALANSRSSRATERPATGGQPAQAGTGPAPAPQPTAEPGDARQYPAPAAEPCLDPWTEQDEQAGNTGAHTGRSRGAPEAEQQPGPAREPEADFGPVPGVPPYRPARSAGPDTERAAAAGAHTGGDNRPDRVRTSGTPASAGSTGHREDGRSTRDDAAGEPQPSTLPWDEARGLASRAGRPLGTVTLPLDQALQHTLTEPLTARTDLPSFDTSAMDGWAVSGPGPWELADPDPDGPGILAGDRRAPDPLPDGRAVRIATGARVPDGASAVLRSEYGEVSGGRLRTAQRSQPGTDIRPRGQECRSGDELLPSGSLVTPAVTGLAAAAGYDELTLVRRPRAEVLVLGDELLRRGPPTDGRIRDALGPMLGPWLAGLGADVLATRHLGDDPEALHEAVSTTTADLLLSTGGTATGPVDHLHPTVRRVGGRLLVDGVRVRPGHPMLLAELPGGAHLVGLPGNPLAALSGLVTLAEPLLRTLAGRPTQPVAHAPLATEVPGHPRDARLVPVAYAPSESHARPLHYTGPAMLRGIATATALAVIPPGGAPADGDVPMLPLPW